MPSVRQSPSFTKPALKKVLYKALKKNRQVSSDKSPLKQSSKEGIQVLGAKEHNLKNINVFIPPQ